MSLLGRHLEQICLSSESIAILPFLRPKIFTNALLSTPDITSLIRDTEPHERALFSVPPPPLPTTSSTPYQDPSISTSSRRQTVFNVTQGEVVTSSTHTSSRAPRKNTAVAAVLGKELHSEVRKAEEKGKGEVDVEILLMGVEKLNAVFDGPGVQDKVAGLRRRWEVVRQGLGFYEGKVERLARELESINKGDEWVGDDEHDEGEEDSVGREFKVDVTDEDLRREEEEIKELERKKAELEERVSGMERDLGGLLR